ncbi:MAG: hypothetical protein ACR2OT_06110 [Parvibaculales bacterium]
MNKSDFEGNYDFLIGIDDDGNIFAHRPIEPAFFIFENTEEKAEAAARDIIDRYVQLFISKSEKGSAEKIGFRPLRTCQVA